MDTREMLSDLQHVIWSEWMSWLFKQGKFNSDGTWTMPKRKVERWQRQMKAAYFDLPDHERELDRLVADRVLEVIEQYPIAETDKDIHKPMTVHEIIDLKFIHGHCAVAEDDYRHIASNNTNSRTLCAKDVTLVDRGLINATCPICRERWHDLNPVEPTSND